MTWRPSACSTAARGAIKRRSRPYGEDLKAHSGDPERITDASIDMSTASIAGVAKHLPNAEIAFDPFHIVQLANQALEEVRREEVKRQPLLKRSRWIWLKDESKWTAGQAELFRSLLKGFDSKLSNGYVEWFNSLVQAAKAKARGYRRTENLIAIAYLLGGKLANLPASPFATRCSGAGV